MILIVSFLVLAALVPIFGGRLSRLASLELRWRGLLYAGFAIQLGVISFLPNSFGAANEIHLLSYGLALAFLYANRSMPGMVLVALGATANFLAIASNGGVMPAAPAALRSAGLTGSSEHFANSGAVSHANLAFLGDVFAVPARFPLANVFSIGDVLLLVGGAVTVHVVCTSRLAVRFMRAPHPDVSSSSDPLVTARILEADSLGGRAR